MEYVETERHGAAGGRSSVDAAQTSSSSSIGLQDVPPEVLLHICGFLPLATACGALPATCRWARDALTLAPSPGAGRAAAGGSCGAATSSNRGSSAAADSSRLYTLLQPPEAGRLQQLQYSERGTSGTDPGVTRGGGGAARAGSALPDCWWRSRALEELQVRSAAGYWPSEQRERYRHGVVVLLPHAQSPPPAGWCRSACLDSLGAVNHQVQQVRHTPYLKPQFNQRVAHARTMSQP